MFRIPTISVPPSGKQVIRLLEKQISDIFIGKSVSFDGNIGIRQMDGSEKNYFIFAVNMGDIQTATRVLALRDGFGLDHTGPLLQKVDILPRKDYSDEAMLQPDNLRNYPEILSGFPSAKTPEDRQKIYLRFEEDSFGRCMDSLRRNKFLIAQLIGNSSTLKGTPRG